MNTHERNELIKCAQDEQYFIETYFNVQHPIHGLSLIDLSEKQLNILDQIKNKTCIVDAIPERQLGASTMLAAHATWIAIFKCDKSIALMGKKLINSQHLKNIIDTGYNHLPEFLKPRKIVDNKQEISFENGTHIRFITPGPNRFSGWAVSYLMLDTFEEYDSDCQLNIYEYSDMMNLDFVQLVLV